MNIKQILFIWVLTLCVSCGREISSDIETQTIDFFGCQTSDEPFPQDYFSNAQLIAIDSEDERFLFSEIDKFVCFNDCFYIYDAMAEKVVVFDSSGKGIGALSRRGRGAQEYLAITDFDVNNSGNIVIVAPRNDALMEYSADGDFVSSRELPFDAWHIACLSDGGFLFSIAHWDTGEYKGKKLAVCDSGLNVNNALLDYPLNWDENFMFPSRGFSPCGDGFIFQEAIDDNLYFFDSDGTLSKKLTVDLGNEKVPSRYLSDIEANLESIDDACSLITGSFSLDDSGLTGGILRKGEDLNFIIDFKTSTKYLSNVNKDGADFLCRYGTRSYWQLLPGFNFEGMPDAEKYSAIMEKGGSVIAVVDSVR